MTTHTEMEPIHVRLTDADRELLQQAREITEEVTPVYGVWQTYTFQGIPQEAQVPQPLLPADLLRKKVRLKVRSPGNTSISNSNSITSPAANTQVAVIGAVSIPPGEYTVTWTVELDGTVSATDLNNFKIQGPFTTLNSINDAAVGRYPQNSFNIVVPTGNSTSVAVKSIAAGTVGAIYSAEVTLTPVNQLSPSGFIAVGTAEQILNNGGGRIYDGDSWTIENHAKLYMVGDGVTPNLVVTLLVERFQTD